MLLDRWILPGFAAFHVILSAAVASGIAPGAATFFALSPANSFFVHFYLWNVVTYPFLDRNFIVAIINGLILLSAGQYVKRNLLDTTYSLFAFAIVTTGFSIFWIEMFFFIFTRWESFLFLEFSGLSVVSASLVIALKLLAGKRSLLPRALPGLKFNHLPFIMLVLSTVSVLIGGALAKEFLPISLGLYFSWVYIRFFRVDPATDLIGNTNVDFQLDGLFPASFRPWLSPAFNIVFKIAVILGFFKKYAKQFENMDSPELESGQSTLQEFSGPTDRRKLIALQAIEEKLRGFKHERKTLSAVSSSNLDITLERTQSEST